MYSLIVFSHALRYQHWLVVLVILCGVLLKILEALSTSLIYLDDIPIPQAVPITITDNFATDITSEQIVVGFHNAMGVRDYKIPFLF